MNRPILLTTALCCLVQIKPCVATLSPEELRARRMARLDGQPGRRQFVSHSSTEVQVDPQDADEMRSQPIRPPAPPALIRRIKYERPKETPDKGRWQDRNWPPSGEWWVFYRPCSQNQKPRIRMTAQTQTQALKHLVEVFEIPPSRCPATLRPLPSPRRQVDAKPPIYGMAQDCDRWTSL